MGGGFLDLGLSLTKLRGPEAWGELGYRPAEHLTLFGRGYVNREDYGAMGGVRYEW